MQRGVLYIVLSVTLLVSFCKSLPLEIQNGNGNVMIEDSATTTDGKSGKVCLTKECREVSMLVKKYMNESADPCDDFYEYSCGQWIEDHPVPKGKLQISAFTELKDESNEMMKKALVVDDYLDSVAPIKKLRTFFRSCLNKKAIDAQGKTPLQHYIKHLDSWALDPKWDAKNWDVFKTLRKVQRDDSATNLFFTVETIADPIHKNEEGNKNILMIDKSTLDLHPIFFLASPKTVGMLHQYMTNVTKLTGVDEETATNASKEVIKFEASLALLSLEPTKRYARVKIKTLEKALPGFDWFDHLSGLVHPKKLTRDDPVLVLATKYLPRLFEILEKTDKTVLSEFVVWRMIKGLVPTLDNDFRKLYNQIKLGKDVEDSRVDECYSFTSKILSNLLGALFLKKRFTTETKADVEEMMGDIIKAFQENAYHESWLSGQSREAVEEKLGSVFSQVGFPMELWNDQMLTAKYEKIEVHEDQWFQNFVNSQKFLNSLELQSVGELVDRKKWIAPPQMVNAFYVLTKNEIVIPAGILQEPFYYSGSIPKALSYGAIGHILGHELTHGFDDQGRTFDKIGKKVTFNETGWSNKSDTNFKRESKCLVKQFNEYKVLGKHHVDGKMTLGENIADAGGVKLAYNAYKRWVKDHGHDSVLPALDKTSDELFFLGFAQKSCSQTSPAGQYMSVTDDEHAPSKYRVIGTLANMKEFAETFKCPLKSKMHPETKCDVW